MPRIIQTYGKKAYEFRENAIVVKVPFNWINIMSNKVGNKEGNKAGNKSVIESLTDTQNKILIEIRNNPNITKARRIELLPVGKTTIDKGISTLKKKGYIERVGSNKSGYWKLL
ncbi:MAG: ATP-dependent DNA helicase [Lachnospiraceae bacterium]|nr:ATP-dependent DNA helicase [Lachnospiraceae bacterium]